MTSRVPPLVVVAFAAAAVAAFVALVVLSRSHGQPVTGRWIHGTLTSDVVLGGLAVRWWARLGKMLQFLAGCSVVFDLIDPQTLRRHGRELRDWHRSYLRLLRSAGDLDSPFAVGVLMRSSVFSDVLGVTPMEDPSPAIVAGTFFTPAGAPGVAAGGSVPHDAMNAWYERTVQALPSAHRCGPRGCGRREPVCGAQREYLDDSITAFLRQYYGDRVEPVAVNEVNTKRVGTLAWAFGLGLMVLLSGLYTLQGLIWNNTFSNTLLFVLMLGLMCLIMVAISSGAGPRLLHNRFAQTSVAALLWVLSVPGGWVLGGVADGLDAARPAHLLRYVAFGLFLTGFLPDLLAS